MSGLTGEPFPPLSASERGLGGEVKLLLVLSLLALVSASCSFGFNPALIRRNNAVRQAALAYELQVRGPADEVLVDFGYLEWRDNLGFADGNTVWLNPAARDEYFTLRNPHRSYIYLRDPLDLDGAVSIGVERGGPAGVQSRQLTLRRAGGAWQVVADESSQGFIAQNAGQL